ncbi:MAG: hypothetical protein AB1847_06805, partial [bacterium]
PAAYGLGLSYRLGNSWTFAGDITRTEWGDYVIYNQNGKQIGPFAKQIDNVPGKDPTYTIRLGAEYAYILDKSRMVLPFRFGVFYDPEPSVKAPQDFYGISLGCGVADRRIALDIAYQFRWGTPINSVELGLDSGQVGLNSEQGRNEGKFEQHFLLASLIFYF